MTIDHEADLECSPAPGTVRERLLAKRVASLGATGEQAGRVVAEAICWAAGGTARLEAAAAMIHALVNQGRIQHGEEAVRVLEDLLSGRDTYIPAPFWRVEGGGIGVPPGRSALLGRPYRPGGAESLAARCGRGPRPTWARWRALSRALLSPLLGGSSFACGAEPSTE